MRIFYHFSHFLEILTGLYFGGIAILAFIEEKGSKSLAERFTERVSDAEEAKVLAFQYFGVRINLGNDGKGALKSFRNVVGLLAFKIVAKPFDRFFNWSCERVKRMAEGQKNKSLQKKFFPSFFYGGIFCISIVLISAMQNENINSVACHKAADRYMIFYLLSTFIFMIWALFIHPFGVNKRDFLHLTLFSLLLVIILAALSWIAIRNEWLTSLTEWYLDSQKEMRLTAWVLMAAILPLLFILGYIFLIFVGWEIPILINKLWLWVFKKRRIQKEIDLLQP